MAHAYTDEDADVILQSNDGTQFRVHSYMLKANSVIFRSMLETCGQERGEPITLDHSSEVLNDFLNLMHLGRLEVGCPWTCCETLLGMIDKYEAATLQSAVIVHLHDIAGQEPWKIFAVASQSGNVTLARTAIDNFPKGPDTHDVNILNLNLTKAETIRLDFLLGLLAALEKSKGDRHKISRAFEPRRRSG